ncbi:hemerythrin HHE cation binding domain-containing protein [Salinisphaera shabanensis T35B1]|uniref:hemerythrin domain-containing protein n=1 Tax=Salinisphaera shabanensis TaxID=180542 RepID=UPI003341DA41
MHTISDNLRLDKRRALPAEIAFLRAKYPAPQWATHGNYGELAAFWLQVHDALREEGRALGQATEDFREGRTDMAAFQRVFAVRLRGYLQHLEGHHRIEDAHYFPRFRRLDERLVYGFDLLENDHEIIHGQLLAVVESAQAFMQDLARGGDAMRYGADAYAERADRLLALLEQHLADEEEIVIPTILEHSERPFR